MAVSPKSAAATENPASHTDTQASTRLHPAGLLSFIHSAVKPCARQAGGGGGGYVGYWHPQLSGAEGWLPLSDSPVAQRMAALERLTGGAEDGCP